MSSSVDNNEAKNSNDEEKGIDSLSEKDFGNWSEKDLNERIKLAEISFKTVLDADLHEDDKASRILGAMAFLTAVATGLFVSVYSSSPSESALTQALKSYVPSAELSKRVSDVMANSEKPEYIIIATIIAFALYITSILIGAFFYLIALGPNLNRPNLPKPKDDKYLSSQNPSEQSEPSSLLFFEKIIKDENNWTSYWKCRSNIEVQKKLLTNYIKESFLIAQKTADKVHLMGIGSWFFKFAVLCLYILVFTLLLSNASIPVWLSLPIGILGLLGIAVAFIVAWRRIATHS